MTRVALTIAISSYDHVRDLFDGSVRIEGIDLNHLDLPVEEIFHRFIKFREWDVSEVSMAKFAALVAAGDTDLVGLPVFPSRTFRHSSIYVRSDSAIADATELRGRRVGLPEWAQTAAVYSRALLQHGYGVPLDSVAWVQAGVDQPGRREKVTLALPAGIEIARMPDRSLSEMLLAGDIDAILSAHTPSGFTGPAGPMRRLVSDLPEQERRYWEQTGIFPIMHTVAVRRPVIEQHPWVVTTLFKAFEEAKRRSTQRALDTKISRFPVPWMAYHAESVYALFDSAEPWPYGVQSNRTTLDAFLGFAEEQGLLARRLTTEDLFPIDIEDQFRI